MPLPQIPLTCYPCFHACHLNHVPTTHAVEALGAGLLAAGAAGRGPMLPHFIQQVCLWGGRRGPSIAARVLNAANNLPATRLVIVNAAIADLAVGNILGAINQIVSLHGFGISFGSKQLRMLRPDLCGVLDALVRQQCCYGNSPADYVQYCLDCSAQALALNVAGILTSTGQSWNAGSVDMAVFAWIRNRSVKRPWNCVCSNGGGSLMQPCPLASNPPPPGSLAGQRIGPPKIRPAAKNGRARAGARAVNATDIASGCFAGKVVEHSFAAANGIVLNRGRIPRNTPVALELGGTAFNCRWNGYGSITGYDHAWFQGLGVGCAICISFDAAKNCVVIV